MPDKNNIQLDPILLRMMRTPGRANTVPGAGAITDNPFLLRQLQAIQPRVMGGMRMPGANPTQAPYKPEAPSPADIMARYPNTVKEPTNTLPEPAPLTGKAKKEARIGEFIKQANLPKQGTDLERNPAIEPFLKILKEENIPFNIRISNQGNTAYIFYGPEGNKKTFTLRVPHPSLPHTGNPKNMDDVRKLIDTAGTESIPSNAKHLETGPLKNASGGSFSDPNNVREALRWQMGKLVSPGSEPFTSTDQWAPMTKGAAFHPKQEKVGQGSMMGRMVHADTQIKMPTIMGGDPNSPLHSQQLDQRFNLVNPQDLGNYGSKQYDPMTDPSYQALLKLLGRHGPNTSNDR